MQIIDVYIDQYIFRIPIGIQGENRARAVAFHHVQKWLDMWPGATVTLAVQLPSGDAYPVEVTTAGGVTTWIITAADTAYAGQGKCELTFLSGEVVKKTVTIPIYIAESFTATGDPPAPVAGWIEDAEAKLATVEAALTAIPAAIDAAVEAAKESGEFDGPPGPGVAPGGSPGQVLAKKSADDYDTEWLDVATEEETRQIITAYDEEEDDGMVIYMNFAIGENNSLYFVANDNSAEEVIEAFEQGKNIVFAFPEIDYQSTYYPASFIRLNEIADPDGTPLFYLSESITNPVNTRGGLVENFSIVSVLSSCGYVNNFNHIQFDIVAQDVG